MASLHERDPQLNVLLQQSRDLITTLLTDGLRSQPCGADGIRFGKRPGTALIEAFTGKGKSEGQDESQETEETADQNPDALARNVASLGLTTPNQETDFVRGQL